MPRAQRIITTSGTDQGGLFDHVRTQPAAAPLHRAPGGTKGHRPAQMHEPKTHLRQTSHTQTNTGAPAGPACACTPRTPCNETDGYELRPVRFATLASSSSGNCAVLVRGSGANHRITLIDCGLSPRRTRLTLASMGLEFDRIDEVLLTHLDQDHCHRGWAKGLPGHARFRIYERHRLRATAARMTRRRTEYFTDEPFSIGGGIGVTPVVLPHDEFGVCAFRFDLPGGGSLGFATDLGEPCPTLARVFRGVDTLAIESNYCPELQRLSDRPQFVKDRVTGGAGHLSNQESARLVREIAPKRSVILLHLSRQCNTPAVALDAHRLNMPAEETRGPTSARSTLKIETASADEPSELRELTGVQ